VNTENLDFLALQETKMEEISESFVHSLWGSADCGWAYLPAVGNSGGILSLWNKVKASLLFTFIGDGFVGVCLDIIGEPRQVFVVNVYAKCNLRDKRMLWGNLLMSKGGFGDGLWCVVGDFNSVRSSSERRGVGQSTDGGNHNEMAAFNTFLDDLGLIDLPLLGRCFTWFHPNGIAMSRLDRILISPAWFDAWGTPKVWVLSRDVTDHCPLVLRYSSYDWGPKPFRFNNFWLNNNEFKELINQTWGEQRFVGWMGFVLKERLKGLKGVVKEWNGRKFGRVEMEKRRLVEEISRLDIKSETFGLDGGEVAERKKLFDILWKTLKNIDALTYQRSRSKWLREGDSNSRYFYNCIKVRQRRNKMEALRTPNGWVEGPIPVREEV
jgi:hypothetical protein